MFFICLNETNFLSQIPEFPVTLAPLAYQKSQKNSAKERIERNSGESPARLGFLKCGRESGSTAFKMTAKIHGTILNRMKNQFKKLNLIKNPNLLKEI